MEKDKTIVDTKYRLRFANADYEEYLKIVYYSNDSYSTEPLLYKRSNNTSFE